MNGIGWLIVVAIGVGAIALQFIPELFHTFGRLLDRLPAKLGTVILRAVIVVGLLAGIAVINLR